MDGASRASPERTRRTAATSCSGETSFSRKPLAPAVSAAYTYWSRSNVVRMMIRQPRAGLGGEDAAGGFQAVHLRHPDIHQHDVGPVLEHGGHGLPAVGGLGHDRDAGRAEDHPEPAADQGLIVGDHDAGRGGDRLLDVPHRRVLTVAAGDARLVAAPAGRVRRAELHGRRASLVDRHAGADQPPAARPGLGHQVAAVQRDALAKAEQAPPGRRVQR